MKDAIIGIDISKKKFDMALLINDKILSKKFENTDSGFESLKVWLAKKGAPTGHVCMEATGVYGDKLALFLYKNNFDVSIVNPAQIKGFAQSELARTKTDKADAKLIARFCKAIKPKLWEPEPEHIQKLQALCRRLDSLISMKIKENNRLEVSNDIIKKNILESINFIEEQIQKVKKMINDIINDTPDFKDKKKLLKTIPGIGEATITHILAFIGEPEKFQSAKQVAAFIGLNPKQRLSGTSVKGKTHISKTGNAALRKAFYMPAIVAKQHNPVIKKFCENLQNAGKNNKSIICAAMRKLIHIIYGVLKSKTPFQAA